MTIKEFRLMEENYGLNLIDQGVISKYFKISSKIAQKYVKIINNADKLWLTPDHEIYTAHGTKLLNNIEDITCLLSTKEADKFYNELNHLEQFVIIDSNHYTIMHTGNSLDYIKMCNDWDYNEIKEIETCIFWGLTKTGARNKALSAIEKADAIRERFSNK